MPDDAKTFMIEGAELIFMNFSGREGPFNREGDRDFSVVLDPTVAEQMLADGWNVKYLAAREEGEEDRPIISVTVSFKRRPPKVVMITSSGKTRLTEDMVGTLDWAEIRNVDLIARAYEWEVNGKTGIKAYLQTMVVEVDEDELERKYGLNDGNDHHAD